MKKLLWSIFLLGNVCLAQGGLTAISLIEETARVFNDMNYKTDGINGHQYLLDEWGYGQITINDSINAPQARIQYDMVAGEPIIGNAARAKKGFILRDKSVTGFVINNTSFVRIETNRFVDDVYRNYFAVPTLSKGNYLLIDYNKTLKEPYVLNNGYNNTELNKKYVTIKKFYILNKDNKYANVRLKEKDILKVLSDKKKELKKYIKSNRLKVKNESDAVKLLAYYHTLK
ncbi:MAG: hypothetical protein V3V28_13775 [Polaribacter sp.]|uniref:hypothetical protein n=1 Tax=Polaribacter sp. TaxID=1920175 RepID=UPI002F34F200